MKVLIASILAALLLLNCRKGIMVAVTKSHTGVHSQLTTVIDEEGKSHHLMYNDHGHLLAYKAGYAATYYKPGNSHFATKVAKHIDEKVTYKNAEHGIGGRVNHFEKYVNEQKAADVTLAYNENGYLINQKITCAEAGLVQEFIYTYVNENLKCVEEYVNGKLQSRAVLEYYNSFNNSLQVDLLDTKQIGLVNDGQFGKQSRNLVKTAKVFDADSELLVQIDHFYKIDEDGNAKSMEMRSGNRKLKTYKFIFQ